MYHIPWKNVVKSCQLVGNLPPEGGMPFSHEERCTVMLWEAPGSRPRLVLWGTHVEVRSS